MSDFDDLQPIGGPRLRTRTQQRYRPQHQRSCFDPEDGSLDCVCGLADHLQEKAESDLEAWEAEAERFKEWN